MFFDSNVMADPFAVVVGKVVPDPKSANAQAGDGQAINTGTEVQAPIASAAVIKPAAGGHLTKRNIIIGLGIAAVIWYLWKRKGPVALVVDAVKAAT